MVAILLALIAGVTALAWIQAQRTPEGRPDYVALGSSFAAGAGLGTLQDGSPLLCARSINGYPQQLAHIRKLPNVDMSCGGAVTKQLLDGGQFFQGPQIRTIRPQTRLVTITVGGNDVGYIGDLQMLAARNSNSLFGLLVKRFWGGPKSPAQRDYAKVQGDLVALLRAIHDRAPNAKVVVATYPTILPPAGTCPQLRLSDGEAELMRQVGNQLASVTRAAAKQEGAILVDMHTLGAKHHACSASPWTKGSTNLSKAPFHPTLAGAKATAAMISQALDHQQL